MEFKNKISDFFGLADNGNVNAFEEQPITENTTVSSQQAQYQSAKSAVPKSKQKKSVMQSSQSKTAKQKSIYQEEPKVVNMKQQQPQSKSMGSNFQKNASKIMILEPRVYSESMTIAKHIINGEAVLVNFHLVDEQQARRIVDFLTGVVYSENGDIKRVGDEIFLCTPNGTEIDGTARTLTEHQLFDM